MRFKSRKNIWDGFFFVVLLSANEVTFFYQWHHQEESMGDLNFQHVRGPSRQG